MSSPAMGVVSFFSCAPGPARRARRRQAARIGLLVVVVFSVLFTAWGIQASFRGRRLAGTTIPDDSGVLYDGARWVVAWERAGFPGLWKAFRAEPAHSPYATATAFASFLIFGMHDWAPYATTAITVFVMLAFVNALMSGAGLWTRVAIILFVGTTPLLGSAVSCVKGDYLSGVLTAIAAVVVVGRPFSRASWKRHVLTGVVFAGALLTKPSVFGQTIPTLGLIMLVGAVTERFAPGPRPSLKDLVRAWALTGATTLVLIAPYAVYAGPRLWSYMWDNVFGTRKHLWETKGDFWFHVSYFITSRHSGRGMLGQHAYIYLALCAVGLVGTLGWGRRYGVARAIGYTVVTLAMYLVATTNPVKNLFFGLPFQCTLALLSVVVLRGLLHEQRRAKWIPPWGSLVLAAATIVACGSFRYLDDWDPHRFRPPPSLDERRAVINSVFDAITEYKARPRTLLLASGVGDIHYPMAAYMGMQRRIELHLREAKPPTPENIEQYLSWANLVLTAEDGTGMMIDWLPANRDLAVGLRYMEARSDFRVLKRVRTPQTGKEFVLFERVK